MAQNPTMSSFDSFGSSGSSLSGFGAGDSAGVGNSGDSELQHFLMIEQQKANYQTQVHRLTDQCWEKCMDKPGSSLDGRTATCFTNCVERFIDTSLAITTKFQQKISQGM